MAEKYPLLKLNKPTTRKKPDNGGGGYNPSYLPNKQINSLSNKFDAIKQQLTAKLQLTTTGLDADTALVIEVKQSIQKFYQFISTRPEYEWLFPTPLVDASTNAVDSNAEEVTGKICYVVMATEKARKELLDCWDTWKKYFASHPEEGEKQNNNPLENGKGIYNTLFREITDIHLWNERDRLEEADGISYLKNIVLEHPNERIKLHVEFFYRRSINKRKEAVDTLRNSLQTGRIIDGSECCIPEIAYHALIAEITSDDAKNIIEYYSSNYQDRSKIPPFLSVDSLFSVSSVGQMISDLRGKDKAQATNESMQINFKELPKPDSLSPVVALFDSIPVENHSALEGRLIIDDPDDYAESTPVSERYHGTSMASLITLGDLSEQNPTPLSRKIYVRPIMNYFESDGFGYERIPESDHLFVDYLHRAVVRLFEGEGDRKPICPSIKIINFSIGVGGCSFKKNMTPLARLIDWLSYKYSVLFVISAGNYVELNDNYHDKLELPIDFGSRELTEDERAKIVAYIYTHRSARKLLSPAESINSLTVGAQHLDKSPIPNLPYLKDPYNNNRLPALYSSFGRGFNNSIKPDFIYPGGRQFIKEREIFASMQYVTIEGYSGEQGCGLCCAAPGDDLDRNAVMYSRGTSNATALVSRQLAFCYDKLSKLELSNQKFTDYSAVLLKAMIVHGCSLDIAAYQFLHNTLSLTSDKISSNEKTELINWSGYGVADLEQASLCNEHSVTLYAFGDIDSEDIHDYSIKIPSEITGIKKIKVTVTLAWLSKVHPNRAGYRDVSLNAEIHAPMSERDKNKNIFNQVTKNSVKKSDARCGTILHLIFENTSELVSDENELIVSVSVLSKLDAFGSDKYGLFVTIELPQQTTIFSFDLNLYNEIKDRNIIPQRIESRTPVRV